MWPEKLPISCNQVQKLSSAVSPCKSMFNILLLRRLLNVLVYCSLKWKAPIMVRRGKSLNIFQKVEQVMISDLATLESLGSSMRMLCRRMRWRASSSISAVHPYLPAPNTSSVSRATSIQMWYSSSGSNPPSTYSEAKKANFWSSSTFQNPRRCSIRTKKKRKTKKLASAHKIITNLLSMVYIEKRDATDPRSLSSIFCISATLSSRHCLSHGILHGSEPR